MRCEPLLEAVQQHMQPAGRAQHVAGTLQQLLAVVPQSVTLEDLAAGWQMLARPRRQQEPASLAHRRQVCAELAAIAHQLASALGQRAGAVKAWQAWQEACQTSTGPRLAGMAQTLARELAELQSV